MDPHEAVEWLSKPHVCVIGKEGDTCFHLAEALKAFLYDRAVSFVKENQDEVLLEIFMSDGTPMTTARRYTIEIDGQVIRRSGRSSREYLMQLAVVMNMQRQCRPVMRDPLLMADKTALTHYRAQYDLWPTARSLGATSIVVSHHVWDMAVKSACERLSRQRHGALNIHMDESSEEEAAEPPANLLWYLSWFTCVGCFAHHGHNALRWGIKDYIDDKDTTRSCWIVLASLRNSFDMLAGHLHHWLSRRLRFADHDDPDSLQYVWRLLGESDAWVEILSTLQIRFAEGRLYLAADLESDPAALDRATAALLHLWQFRAWSDSRWCGIGASARALLGCLLCGLPSLVSDIISDPTVSKYYIQGFDKLSKRVKRMMVVVACSSRVSENFLKLVLADDRLPQRLATIDEQMREDVSFVEGIPKSVLAILSSICDTPATALRDEILASTQTQVGYLQVRLRQVSRLPWSLVGGDVTAKLQSLREGPVPEEETSQKIYKLLHMSFSQAVIEQGIAMLAECPWTSKLVEQPHAAVKSLMKAHSAYGRDMMMARSMILQCRIFFRLDADERRIFTLTKRIARLKARQPSKITGRHMFVRAVTRTASLYKAHGKDTPKNYQVQILKNHGQMYKKLPILEKRHYDDEKIVFQAEQEAATRAKVATLSALLKVWQQRFRHRNVERGTSFRLGLCRLSQAELAQFDLCYYDDRWNSDQLALCRQAAVAEVGPPTSLQVQVLESMNFYSHPLPAVARGDWLNWLAAYRDMLKNSILKVEKAEGVEYFAFAYASQNPVFVCLNRAELVEVSEHLVSPFELFHHEAGMFDHRFALQWSFVFSDEGLLQDWIGLSLLLHGASRDGQLCFDGEWLCISELQKDLPTARAVAAAEPKAKKPSSKDAVCPAVEPWMHHISMWEFVINSVQNQQQPSVKKDLAADDFDLSGSSTSSDDDDDEAFDAARALADRRDELRALDGMMPDLFTWNLRGGSWTAAHLGVAYDSYRAFARGGSAKQFCRLHRLKKSATFAIARYGERKCLLLVRLWIHRMQFLFQIWHGHGTEAALPFTPALLAEYRVPAEFEALFHDAHEPTRLRALEIRARKPPR